MNIRISSLFAIVSLLILTTACSQQVEPDAETLTSLATNTGENMGTDVSAKVEQENNSKSGELKTLDVYKTESCGCCGGWVTHMEDNNFATRVHHPEDLNQIKTELGIDTKWQSCHTAVSEQGYVFEGHIPSNVISDFLASPPENALGLAVPGMPVGSPGMEVEERFSPYDVLLLKKDGSVETYRHIATREEQY